LKNHKVRILVSRQKRIKKRRFKEKFKNKGNKKPPDELGVFSEN